MRIMNAKEKVLFILAGVSCVGKTTLLCRALQNNIPLFGKEYDEAFRSIRIPQRFPEFDISFAERLQANNWFSLRDGRSLANLQELPRCMLLHMDLLTLAVGTGRPWRSLASDAQNILKMQHNLANSFYQRFDVIVVNTVYAPWRLCAERYQERLASRAAGVPETGRRVFFELSRPRDDIHLSIYRSWIRSLDVLRPRLSLFSQYSGKNRG